MAVSEKQFAANRRNARKGGVKMARGKALTRLNALKHGLLSQEVLLPGERREALLELEQVLVAELQPLGELERILVDRMVSSAWRLKRALMVERETMEWEYVQEMESSYNLSYSSKEQTKRQACRDMIASDHTERIMRYETAIERQIYRALHELIRLQMARQGEKPPAPVAIDMEVSRGD